MFILTANETGFNVVLSLSYVFLFMFWKKQPVHVDNLTSFCSVSDRFATNYHRIWSDTWPLTSTTKNMQSVFSVTVHCYMVCCASICIQHCLSILRTIVSNRPQTSAKSLWRNKQRHKEVNSCHIELNEYGVDQIIWSLMRNVCVHIEFWDRLLS